MTAIGASESTPPLPALSTRLEEPLRIVAGRVRLLRFLRGVAQWLVLTLASLLVAVLVLGAPARVPRMVSIPVAALAWGVVAYGAIRFLRPALRRQNLSAAAEMVDQAVPQSHERIRSAVELSQEPDKRFRGSPELVAYLIRQAEYDAENVDPQAVVSSRKVVAWALYLVPLGMVWLILCSMMGTNMAAGLQRTLAPWTSDAPLAAPTLQVSPGDIELAQGDTLTIGLAVTLAEQIAPGRPDRTERATLLCKYPGGQNVSAEMERTGDLSFRAIMENVQQSFSYRINADGTESATYQVTVLPRPAVSGEITLDYTFPAYTRLKARTDRTRDGTVDAIVGTHVKVTLETNQKIQAGRLLIGEKTPEQVIVPLAAVAGAERKYAGELAVTRSAQYRIQLTGGTGPTELTNRDDQLRSIFARVDAAPQVSIVAPVVTLKVRPDDTVPVQFTASDDFGLARLEALVHVDDGPANTLEIPLPGDRADPARYSGQWDLAVGAILRAAVAGDAKRVSYQLRVTDNRAPTPPGPQTGLSAQMLLEIDRAAAPLAEREDAAAAKDLAAAVKQAQEKLDEAQRKIDALKQADATRALTAPEKRSADSAKRELTQSSEQLHNAAEKSRGSSLKELAEEARQVADKPMMQAAEEMAKSQLAADEPGARKENLEKAGQDVAEAKKELEKLARELDAAAKDQGLASALERIAAEQRKLDEQLAKNPKDPALLAKQRELQKELEKLIKENPELQKPAADAAEATAQDLLKRIEELKTAQQPIGEKLQSQADAARTKEALGELARKQQGLNEQVDKFNREQGDSLKQAGARAPDKSQMDPIVKDLQSSKLQNAAQGQKAAAAGLDGAADKLDGAQKKTEDSAAARDAAAKRAGEDAKAAGALREEAKKLGEQIEQAKKDAVPPTRPSDPANQAAGQLADKVKQEAKEQGKTPAEKGAADEASKLADEAQRDAREGQAEAAQKKLAEASDKLAQAADAAKKAAESAAAGGPKGANGQASQQARGLAEQQKQLAAETAKAAKSLDDAQAAREQSGQIQEQQKALAEKIDQAAKDAGALQEKTRGSAPETAQRAGKAAQSLQQAAGAERAAASEQQRGNAAKAAGSQQESGKGLAEAADALAGKGSGPSQSSGGAGGQAGQPSKGQDQSAGAGSGQGGGAGNPSSAQGGGSKSGGGQGQSGAAGGNSGGSSGTGASGAGGSGAGEAAKDVQSAHSLQGQAANGDAGAGGKAAEALGRAATTIREGAGRSTSGTGQGVAQGAGHGGTLGAGSGQDGKVGTGQGSGSGNSPGGTASNTGGGSGQGIKPGATVSEVPLPKAVQDIGLSPSDWARLPQAMQSELLHSAQQSGPPSYREMIKNYYTRIARLQDENGAAP